MRTFSRCIRHRVTQWFLLLLMSMLAGLASAANDPDHVSFTLEGCKGDVLSADYDPVNFLCTDALYTTGNLGKGWNELDIVPHRLTTEAGNAAPASQTYRVGLTLDYESAGNPGYDLMTEPVINIAKSDPSCSIALIDYGTAPDAGDTILYRLIDITQDKNSTCVIDWAGRLALGSHLYPGSSLHAHTKNQVLTTTGIGNKDVSIPVKEILPQELDKSMTAERDSVKTWSISKTSNPANISFGDTCEIDPAGNSQQVTVTVDWSVVENPAGEITVVTDVTATNPAHRKLLISVTDEIFGDFGGGYVLLPFLTVSVTDVEIEANSDTLVLHHVESFDQADLGGIGDINDLISMMDTATATYTDFAFPEVMIPGEVTADASTGIASSGVVLNDTAYITDVENITGTGFSFSVDSVVPNDLGSFTDGDASDGEVTWQSDPQTTGGSVTFNKTVYLDMPRNSSGSISDVATIYPSDSASSNDNASTGISATATSELTIYKTVDIAPDGDESFTFNFDVSGGVGIVPINFGPGETSDSAVISNLAPDLYTVTEQALAGFTINSTNPQNVDLGTALVPICAGSASFANIAQLANVQVIKVTDPAGSEAGWEFTLTGPGVNETDTTDGTGSADFGALTLGEGIYTMTETGQSGWDLTGVTNPDGSTDPAQCTFEVDLPADAGQTFTCTFENTQRGTIIIEKVLNGEVADSGTFNFDTNDVEGVVDFSLGATVGVVPNCATDLQCRTFGDLKPAVYSFAELGPTGDFSFVSLSCSVLDGGGDGNDSLIIEAGQSVDIGLAPGETVKCTYTNFRAANPGSIIIEKYVVGPDGTTVITDRDATFGYDTTSVVDGVGDGGVSLPAHFDLLTVNGVSSTSPLFTNIFAGDHTITEDVPFGYTQDRVECEELGGAPTGDDSTGGNGPSAIANVSLDDGETIICRFYNKPLPRIRVIKDLIPDTDDGLFNLLVDGGIEAAAVGDGGDTGWVTVDAGIHDVSETGAGTDLNNYVSKVECDNGTSVIPGTSLVVGFVDYNEDVTCTITNTRKGNIQIVKNSIGGDGTFGYGGTLGLTELTTSGGTADTGTTYYNLEPGTYTVSEDDPTPLWDLTDLSCTDTDNTVVAGNLATIELDPGETVVCTFENTRRGNIQIVKNSIGGDGSFDYSGTLGLTNLTTSGGTADTGTTYYNLVPGPYSVSEVDPAPDWDLTDLSCTDTDNTSVVGSTANIVLDPGETVVCTFENTKRIMIDLLKTFNGLIDPSKDMVFSLWEGPDGFGGTHIVDDNTFGDADGLLEFGGIKLSASGTYTVCEEGIPVGTTANWSLDIDGDGVGDAALSPYNPDGGEDLGNRCVDFGTSTAILVEPGDTLHLVVDNQRPEGDRRTPGYWKNWNMCSNGNQAEVAAKNGGFSEGFWLLEDLIPGLVNHVGAVPVEDCETAVAILDSRSLSSGKKMARYADFTLARALLASKLNLAVPTSDCSPSVQAVADAADQLLIDVGYDATTGQLRPKDAEYGYALYLAGILDDFNNNICTPYVLP